MRGAVVAALVAFGLTAASAHQEDALLEELSGLHDIGEVLSALRWDHRLLIVPAELLDEQVGRLDPTELRERDILFLVVYEEGRVRAARHDPETSDFSEWPVDGKGGAQLLRRRFGLDEGRVVLVGKDGTRKESWPGTVSMPELSAIIDAMPMRRREMQQP